MESNTAATKIASPCSHPFPARSRHDLGACYIPSGLSGNANPLLICGSGRDVENTIRYQPTSASAAAWRVFIPRGLTNTIVKSESSRDSAASVTREARSAEAKRGAEAETSEHLI